MADVWLDLSECECFPAEATEFTFRHVVCTCDFVCCDFSEGLGLRRLIYGSGCNPTYTWRYMNTERFRIVVTRATCFTGFAGAFTVMGSAER